MLRLCRELSVNALERIQHDDEGFGGHTPIFNAIVSDAYVNGSQPEAYVGRRIIESGADINVRVNLRNVLARREEPGWHIKLNVTPLEWTSDFSGTLLGE